MTTLDEIGNRFQTDKSSAHHHYLELYELLFREIRSLHSPRILEIGVQWALSLKTWKEYFPSAVIYGIDAADNGVQIDGVSILIGNAYSVEMLEKVNTTWQIIIDDGSHAPDDQIFVVKEYSHLLDSDGILIVEDVPSKQTVERLKAALPAGFQYMAIEMVEGKSLADSRLFIVWRKL